VIRLKENITTTFTPIDEVLGTISLGKLQQLRKFRANSKAFCNQYNLYIKTVIKARTALHTTRYHRSLIQPAIPINHLRTGVHWKYVGESVFIQNVLF